MISAVISRLVIIVFGTLYPAYSSFKAVKTKNVKEYVKWMMYWIVFALFTTAETFADILLAFWCPFYYEMKIILVIWLLSPTTQGSSILYRRFVHPQLIKREREIDEYIARTTEQGYSTVLQLGRGGFNFASQFLMQTALRGGGTLVDQLRRSYSLSDLTAEPHDLLGPKRRAITVGEEVMSSGGEQVWSDQKTEKVDVVDVADSETDNADSPTQSTSGYSSARTTGIRKARKDPIVGVKRRTRTTVNKSSGSGGGSGSPKAESEVVEYATLPRMKKTRRKTAQVY